MCPNKNKSQKKLQSSPSNVPKQEKEVLREKSSNPISPPIIRSGPWFQDFQPQLWRLYRIQKEGMKQIEGMEQGMGLERTFWKIGVCLFIWM